MSKTLIVTTSDEFDPETQTIYDAMEMEGQWRAAEMATADEIARARSECCADNIQVDNDAQASRTSTGVWIQCWLWLPS